MFPLRITQVAYPPRDLRFPAYVHLLARYKFPTAVSATLYAGVFPDIDLSQVYDYHANLLVKPSLSMLSFSKKGGLISAPSYWRIRTSQISPHPDTYALVRHANSMRFVCIGLSPALGQLFSR
jgi:hypothetical protein